MGKIARNEPCPCGSGKKYKKCCLESDQARGREAHSPESPSPGPNPLPEIDSGNFIETDLDALSNGVLDLIREGNFERAEEACRELLARFPDQVDGLLRLGQLHKARGERLEAADCLRKAAEFIRARPDWFDLEFAQSLEAEANELAASHPPPETEGGARTGG